MRTIRSICVLLSLVLAMLAIPARSSARVGISITIAPPLLPVYVQPVCPGDGYIWTPGYWAYGDDGYYWVPGTWVLAPEVGFLWTPGYWGWASNVYVWHAGYWGPRIGFYGGINYGFGYTGVGYAGGYWSGGHFFYNRSVNNVNVTEIHNTYNRTVVINNAGAGRASFNGGHGGTTMRPTAAERAAARDHHISATSLQEQHQREASTNRSQFASVNHGKPAIAATAKPAEFSGHGLVAAKAAGGRYEPVADRTSSGAPSSSPSREARPAETKPAPRENKPAAHVNKPEPERATPTRPETKSSTPPHTAAPRTETRPSTTPAHVAPSRTESKPAVHENKPAPERSTPTRTESKPATSPHATAPRAASKPTEHESAPRSEHAPPAHAAPPRSTAPPAQNTSRPPAQHAAAPRPQSKPEAAPRPQSKPEQHPESEHPH